VEEADEGAGEEGGGVAVEGVGGDGEGDLSTHSNHAPARPDDMHAARMARRPTLALV
jgi:hypothetical protein